MNAPRFRTILHGKCLLKAGHPPGDSYAAECPETKRAARKKKRAEKGKQRGGQ